MTMRIGVSYAWPWNAYGTYFGSPALGAWTESLAENLDRLRDVGVDLVRVFLFGNAWTIGRIDRGVFVPGGLPPASLDQLEAMLVAFERRQMQVLPSLLDFQAAMGPAGKSGFGGRGALISTPSFRADFLGTVLEPLLLRAEGHRAAVYAWEAMNEPIWTTLNPFTSMRGCVSDYLREATARIEEHGFASTVGHRFASDLETFPTGSIRQCHYYPRQGWRSWLPFTEQPLASHASTRAILGEFGVRDDGSQGDDWPEIAPELQRDPRRRVLERLRAAESRGYEVAIAWPDLEGSPFGTPDALKLSPAVQQGLSDYAASRRSGGCVAQDGNTLQAEEVERT